MDERSARHTNRRGQCLTDESVAEDEGLTLLNEEPPLNSLLQMVE
jgi:hypothetical protein